ncbi:MAG: CDP-alcohol phosphatidyltransferase family protein [Bdellovibrionota bacterium]
MGHWRSRKLEALFFRFRIQPDHVTWAATLLVIPCGYLLATGHFLAAGWLNIFIGSLDILDGKLARALNVDSKRGELLDAVLDRYQDFFILVGLLYFFQDHWIQWVIVITMGASGWISYIKAKAELVGANLKRVGMMQRPERFFTLSAGLMIDGIVELSLLPFESLAHWPNHIVLKTVLVFLAIMTNWTAFERFRHSLRQLS